MIESFASEETKKLFEGRNSSKLPPELQRAARRKLLYLDSAENLQDLKAPPGNRLEKLKGSRAGQHSIRIHDQWRICFNWIHKSALNVEITDYHDREHYMDEILRPIHPGEVLLEDFMKPLGITQYRLSREIGVQPIRINQIIKGKRSITADTALRLGKYFGTSPAVWLRLQMHFDLENAKQALSERIEREVKVYHR